METVHHSFKPSRRDAKFTLLPSAVYSIRSAEPTFPHHDERHGTTTLFAALNVLEGAVIGRCMQRHRHLEFICFLNAIESPLTRRSTSPSTTTLPISIWRSGLAVTPPALDFPLYPDLAFLARHGRELLLQDDPATHQARRIRSITDPQAAINAYLAEHNASPKPFVWTKSADAMLAKLHRLPVPSV